MKIWVSDITLVFWYVWGNLDAECKFAEQDKGIQVVLSLKVNQLDPAISKPHFAYQWKWFLD